jgi:site-specific recombinase XerD
MSSIIKKNSSFIAKYSKQLLQSGKTLSTRESYSYDANEFLCFLSKNNIEITLIEANTLEHFSNHLNSTRHISPNSIRRKIIAIRGFLRFLAENKYIHSSPFDLSIIPKRLEFLPEPIHYEDIDLAFEVLQSYKHILKKHRDAAILALLCYEGIKTNELINLRWTDFLLLREVGSINIKSDRKRIIHLSAISTKIMSLHKQTTEKKLTPPLTTDRCIFISFRGKEQTYTSEQMTRHGLKHLLSELGKKIGINTLNAELLRHFAIRYQLHLGKTQEEIMSHLGLRRSGNITKHIQQYKKDLQI